MVVAEDTRLAVDCTDWFFGRTAVENKIYLFWETQAVCCEGLENCERHKTNRRCGRQMAVMWKTYQSYREYCSVHKLVPTLASWLASSQRRSLYPS